MKNIQTNFFKNRNGISNNSYLNKFYEFSYIINNFDNVKNFFDADLLIESDLNCHVRNKVWRIYFLKYILDFKAKVRETHIFDSIFCSKEVLMASIRLKYAKNSQINVETYFNYLYSFNKTIYKVIRKNGYFLILMFMSIFNYIRGRINSNLMEYILDK